MIIKHDTVQMVDFMLHHDGVKTFETQLNLVARLIAGFDLNLLITRYESLHRPIHRQAAFALR
ncbi:hypothetical protein D3C75_1352810 [compost metagenome]